MSGCQFSFFLFFFSSKNIKTSTISSLAIISHRKECFTSKEVRIRKFENEEQYFKLNRLYEKPTVYYNRLVNVFIDWTYYCQTLSQNLIPRYHLNLNSQSPWYLQPFHIGMLESWEVCVCVCVCVYMLKAKYLWVLFSALASFFFLSIIYLSMSSKRINRGLNVGGNILKAYMKITNFHRI